MSISSSLSNALSGLSAASRAADVVSSNVANALTPGYGRRELDLASRTLGNDGAGVSVNGIQRIVDESILASRRLADASFGKTSATARFFSELQTSIGLPGDKASLTGKTTKLETTLIEAASRPESDARLASVASAAKALATKFNSITQRIQNLRLEADKNIGHQVLSLNRGLDEIARLNGQIRVEIGSGHDASGLMDLRQKTIDSISGIVPLRQVSRDHGQIALFTPGGAILLDGRAAKIGFTPAHTIVPQMTIGTGALSGLTINGQPVSTESNGPLGGGGLTGSFAVRDDLAPTAQARLDAVARDMIERFSNPAVDPTLPPGAAGIFSDAGTAFLPANETGIAGRISFNPIADPEAGGALWHLRDGLGATTQGFPGNAAILLDLGAAIRTTRIPASGGFTGAAQTASGLSGSLVSLVGADLEAAKSDQSFAAAQRDALLKSQLEDGVDTDHEMQQMMLIERAYSSNARVVSAIDKMIETLLGL